MKKKKEIFLETKQIYLNECNEIICKNLEFKANP